MSIESVFGRWFRSYGTTDDLLLITANIQEDILGQPCHVHSRQRIRQSGLCLAKLENPLPRVFISGASMPVRCWWLVQYASFLTAYLVWLQLKLAALFMMKSVR